MTVNSSLSEALNSMDRGAESILVYIGYFSLKGKNRKEAVGR